MTGEARPDRHKMPGPRLSGSLTDEQYKEILYTLRVIGWGVLLILLVLLYAGLFTWMFFTGRIGWPAG